MHLMAVTKYSADTAVFEGGDTLLMYTDGVIEARNREGEFHPLAERIGQWTGHGPEALLQHLRRDLLAYCGGRLGDDAAAIAEIWNAQDREHAAAAARAFATDYGARWPKAVAKITDDLDELLAFYDYPAEHWIQLRTTIPVESTFATARLRQRVTKDPAHGPPVSRWRSS